MRITMRMRSWMKMKMDDEAAEESEADKRDPGRNEPESRRPSPRGIAAEASRGAKRQRPTPVLRSPPDASSQLVGR